MIIWKGLRRHCFMSNPIMYFCIMKYWWNEIIVSRYNYRWRDNIAIVKSCLNMKWYLISFYWTLRDCVLEFHILYYCSSWLCLIDLWFYSASKSRTASLRPDISYKVKYSSLFVFTLALAKRHIGVKLRNLIASLNS